MKLYQGILASCNRHTERMCIAEIKYTLTNKFEIKKSDFKSYLTGISGLVSIELKVHDPIDIVQKLAELEKEQEYFVNTLKIKPIQKTVDADYEEMKEAIPDLVKDKEGSYRITITKRHTGMKKDVLIDAAASVIENPVDLTNYDWELLIEIVGNKVGLSAVDRGIVFSTKKAFETTGHDDWFLDE